MKLDEVKKDRVPFKPDLDSPEITKIAPIESKIEGRELGYMDDLEYHRVADALDISYDDRKATNMAEKLSYLYDWAKATLNTDDRIARVEGIKNLQKMLGIQGKGPEIIKKLYQYARLDQDRRRIERQMETMKNE